MREHHTDLPEDIAKLEGEEPGELLGNDFDASSVFADPVGYLAGLGLQSELVGTQPRELPAAA